MLAPAAWISSGGATNRISQSTAEPISARKRKLSLQPRCVPRPIRAAYRPITSQMTTPNIAPIALPTSC